MFNLSHLRIGNRGSRSGRGILAFLLGALVLTSIAPGFAGARGDVSAPKRLLVGQAGLSPHLAGKSGFSHGSAKNRLSTGHLRGSRSEDCGEGLSDQGPPEVVMTFSGVPKGKSGMVRMFAISEAHEARLPEWSPGRGKPPLGVSPAYRKASEAIGRELRAGSGNYRLKYIRLVKKSSGKERVNWFYVILFTGKSEPSEMGPRQEVVESRTVAVLMDGTVLLGQIVPEKRMFDILRSGGGGDCQA